jgi:hypothetical protein
MQPRTLRRSGQATISMSAACCARGSDKRHQHHERNEKDLSSPEQRSFFFARRELLAPHHTQKIRNARKLRGSVTIPAGGAVQREVFSVGDTHALQQPPVRSPSAGRGPPPSSISSSRTPLGFASYVGTEPMSRNFQLASYSFAKVHQRSGTAELIGYQLTNYAGAEARSGRRNHIGAPLSCH